MVGVKSEVWRLVRQDEPVGEVVVDSADFPWLYGRFVPGPGFAAVEPWFTEAAALVEADEWERFEECYDRIASTLTLVGPKGPAAEFLLHIEGDQARFRWSDEPFDEA
ncbi:hypothetical protein [Kitasatospora sp. NPDC008115]|uniref:hypothetical protein n=1 Tax=Kitasatospora sp. NPDC008115 TaxID=3364022 RepID=UPI0036E87628